MSDERAHTLAAVWETDSRGDAFPRWSISCPYSADEDNKPCRIWGSEDDKDGTTEPGCWVDQCIEAVGIDGVSLQLPAKTSGPWSVYVRSHGDYPDLIAVDLFRAGPL